MTAAIAAKLPEFLRHRPGEARKSPVYLIVPASGDFDRSGELAQRAFNAAIRDTLAGPVGLEVRPPVLLKVHVGERGCTTRMDQAYLQGTLDYVADAGVDRVFCGDTTVVYSGPRGDRANGPAAETYRELVREHGWDAAAPFVVLDRPGTAIPGVCEFAEEESVRELDLGGRFRRFALSGGFAASGTVVHHAHLTLHLLSHVALCVKGLTMGLASRSGKLAMHQSYHPVVDEDRCARCGECIEACPETALADGGDGLPSLDRASCIGCGECMAVCPEEAITMAGAEITDWRKGMDSLPLRMTDYLMGLMAGRWEDLVNVAHLYNITPLCDCVDKPQKPVCGDIGFLVGRNPFAVDRAARTLLEERLAAEGIAGGIARFHDGDQGEAIFEYATEKYGIITEPEIIRVEVSA